MRKDGTFDMCNAFDELIRNLMHSSGYSVDQAMKLLLIPEEDQESYRVIILEK